jgi:hypothetical protein
MEQAREWFASDVLQPLMVAINSAHAEVIAGAAQLGFSGVRLTPLTDLGTRETLIVLLVETRSLALDLIKTLNKFHCRD